MLPLSDVLARTYKILSDHFSLLAGYVGWLLLPLLAEVFLQSLPQSPIINAISFVILVVSVILFLRLTIILSRLVYGLVHGVRLSHELLQADINKLMLPVALILFVQGVIIGGLAPLILPALIIGVWIGFAHLSVILDGKRPLEALFYSHALSRGRFFGVAWRLLGGTLVWVGVYMSFLLIILTIAAFLTKSWDLMTTDTFPTWFNYMDTIGRLFILSPILFIHTICVYETVRSTVQESTSTVSPPISSP